MLWIQHTFGPAVPLSHVIAILTGCYSLGCIATGYYLVRLLLGCDVRETGSGSVGAKNVGRLLGVRGFLLTLGGDLAKGMCAVWLIWHFTRDDRLAALAMLAVVAGHIWPLQLGLRGGKGVATSFGALLSWDLRLALAGTALVVVLCCLLRRTVPSGLIAFALLPLLAFSLGREAWQVIALSLLSAMVLAAHWRNLVDEVAHFAARRSVPSTPDQS
jgi:glycerol-3-phosphate acyltransferase PlsY